MRISLLIIGFLMLIPQFSFSQWTQQGADIDGEIWGDESGYAVSLNADGSRVAIGAPGNDGNGDEAGHVRVYEFNGANWVQLGSDIDGEAFDNWSGFSVSLNDAGTIVAIGAPFNNADNSGHVRIYEFNGADWIQLGSDINGAAASDQSGYAVSVNSNGDRVAIGARHNDGNGLNAGHVRIYEFNGANWVQLGSDINGEAANDFFGGSVSLNNNGDRVAVGAPFNAGNGMEAGHVRVYEFNGANWIQMGQDIDGNAGTHFGWSLSLNGDGSYLAAGAPYTSGYARMYHFDGVNWNQVGSDILSEAPSDEAGRSVSMSDDGAIVAIGAPYNDSNGNNDGHVRVYEYDGADWVQLGMDIDGEAQPGTGNYAGFSVSLSSDGSIVAMGAPYNDGNTGVNFDNRGHVQVYNNPLLLYTAIPDPNFEQYLIDQGIDSEGILDGQALTSDIAVVTSLNIVNLGIADLTGIEDFAALVSLDCTMNLLTSLDMSANDNLVNLVCSDNQITDLDVSNSGNLRRLYCQNNQLTSLNVSGNTALRGLYCQGNQLGSLDLTGLSLLRAFNGSNNPMLTCIAVDDPVSAAAQLGLYDNWIVDDLMLYSAACGMMAKNETASDIKDPENNGEVKEEINAAISILVYPNPAVNRLQIALPVETAIVSVVFYNLRGEQVLEAKTGDIDISSLAEGVYFAAVQTPGNEVVYRKIMVSRD